MNSIPKESKYDEIQCIESMVIIHVDWGNIKIEEGEVYKRYSIEGDYYEIEIYGMLWFFPSKCFIEIN
jgi:hypothetical protein